METEYKVTVNKKFYEVAMSADEGDYAIFSERKNADIFCNFLNLIKFDGKSVEVNEATDILYRILIDQEEEK